MSVLYVCDGCDVRAQNGGLPPDWMMISRRDVTTDRWFTAHACYRDDCRTKVNTLSKAPEPIPF